MTFLEIISIDTEKKSVQPSFSCKDIKIPRSYSYYSKWLSYESIEMGIPFLYISDQKFLISDEDTIQALKTLFDTTLGILTLVCLFPLKSFASQKYRSVISSPTRYESSEVLKEIIQETIENKTIIPIKKRGLILGSTQKLIKFVSMYLTLSDTKKGPELQLPAGKQLSKIGQVETYLVYKPNRIDGNLLKIRGGQLSKIILSPQILLPFILSAILSLFLIGLVKKILKEGKWEEFSKKIDKKKTIYIGISLSILAVVGLFFLLSKRSSIMSPIVVEEIMENVIENATEIIENITNSSIGENLSENLTNTIQFLHGILPQLDSKLEAWLEYFEPNLKVGFEVLVKHLVMLERNSSHSTNTIHKLVKILSEGLELQPKEVLALAQRSVFEELQRLNQEEPS